MADESHSDVTRILRAIRDGDSQASENLLAAVYDELRALARRHMRQERPNHILQTTALVHEAYLRLVTGCDGAWQNRRHFFAAAGEAMRRILVEWARHTAALKRGGDRRRIALNENEIGFVADATEVLALNDSLSALERIDKRKSDVVKLRYFGGMTIEETAEALDVTPATVKRDWQFARAWLHESMAGPERTPQDSEAHDS